MEEKPEIGLHNLLFDVRRSVRYHDHREGFFTLIRNAADLFVFVGMSAAVMEIATEFGSSWPLYWQLSLPLTGAVLVGIALVYQVGPKSALHNALKRRFIVLEQKLIQHQKSITEELLVELQQERLIVESEEPPILRVLDTICYNEIVWSMDLGHDHMKQVTRLQRLFAHFFDLQEERLRTC